MSAGDAGPTAARNAAAVRGDPRQAESHGRLRANERRHDLTGRILCTGERQCDDRRRLDKWLPGWSADWNKVAAATLNRAGQRRANVVRIAMLVPRPPSH